MKRWAMLGFVGVFFCVTVAWADIIETKKDGILNGTILSENEKEVQFKDAKGQTRIFNKTDVLFQEKEAPPQPVAKTAEKAWEWVKQGPKNVKRMSDQLTDKFIGSVSQPLDRSAVNAKSDELARALDEASKVAATVSKNNKRISAEARSLELESYGTGAPEKKKGRFESLSD